MAGAPVTVNVEELIPLTWWTNGSIPAKAPLGALTVTTTDPLSISVTLIPGNNESEPALALILTLGTSILGDADFISNILISFVTSLVKKS